MNLSYLKQLKQQQNPIAVLTAYDATMAKIMQTAGIDMIVVGDSLGNVIHGEPTTIGVTIDDMIYHAKLVAKGAADSLRMVDMPFATFANKNDALNNAQKLMQKGGAHIVKIEISSKSQLDIVQHLIINSVPVCVHIGLLPQNAMFDGYKKTGIDENSIATLQELAVASQQVGASLLLFEFIDDKTTKILMQSIDIPVIGIGSGGATDGQVLVINDVLGIGKPNLSFTKNFLETESSIQDAIQAYIKAVKNKSFP